MTMKDDYDRLVEAVRCIVEMADKAQRQLSDSYVAFISHNHLYVAIHTDPSKSIFPWGVHSDDDSFAWTSWRTPREVAEEVDNCINRGMVDVSDEATLIHSTFRL